MNTPTATRPPRLPNPAPTGSREVLCIIAKRVPQKDLFRFAVLVCVVRLLLAAIACFGISQVATKPAKVLVSYFEQHTIGKPATAPEPPPHPPD